MITRVSAQRGRVRHTRNHQIKIRQKHFQTNSPTLMPAKITDYTVFYIYEAGNENIDMFSELEFGANMCIHG